MNKTYKLSELKGVLKVGDKVKAYWCDRTSTDGIGAITGIDMQDNTFYINGCQHSFGGLSELTIIFEPKTMDNLEVGDVLVNNDNRLEYKVQAVSGELIFYSAPNKFNRSESFYHVEEIKSYFTLKNQDPKPETIEINGKKYNKAEFENALKDLKEVE